MKIFALLLILVIVSGTNHQNRLNYTKQRSMTAIMAEVEIKIKSHAPLDAVLNVLTLFRDSVNEEQVNHDQIFNLEQNECQNEYEFRNAEIQNAKNTLRDSNAQLSICQYTKQRTTDQQQVNQQQENTFQQHLNTILTTAESEQGYFKKRSRQYEDSLHSIDEALTILEGISNGYRSFSELSKVSQKMLQTSFDINKTGIYAPIFNAFIGLANQGESVDLSSLQQVEHLLNDLRSTIQEAFNQFTDSNAQSVGLFNLQQEKVKKVLTRLEQQYERQQAKLEKSQACIGVQSAVSNSALSKQQRNEQLFEQAKALCSTFENEYNLSTKSRRNEIQLVNQLEDMVRQRFEVVKEEKAVFSTYAKLKY
ncbi:unnamed protein product [Paramecium sonneborni]|uniref:Trichocyst matrix protein n=1 Tax=Paramecium sonneborni TaxID=65129 RepID=A0A8S1P9M9_9CILI|nr:unnamed protein product [Paramecium sonneborni]